MKVFVALALVALIAFTEARPRRDLKSDLIARGNTLLKSADDAVKKLETDHKVTSAHEISIVKTEEARIKKLLADLDAATDDAKIKTIEAELSRAEHLLQFELQKINHTPILPVGPGPVIISPPISILPVEPVKTQVSRDLKSDLITRGQALVKRADETIKKLEADKKTHEATVIKTEEAKIQKLVTDLQAATDDAAAMKLEHELQALEARLAHELNRINTPIIHPNPPVVIKDPVTRDAKSDLLAKAQALLKKADEEIKKLSADTTKAHEVTILKTEEAQIKKLIADVEATTDEAKLKTVEHDLTTADHKLQTELAKIKAGSGTKTTPTPAPTF